MVKISVILSLISILGLMINNCVAESDCETQCKTDGASMLPTVKYISVGGPSNSNAFNDRSRDVTVRLHQFKNGMEGDFVKSYAVEMSSGDNNEKHAISVPFFIKPFVTAKSSVVKIPGVHKDDDGLYVQFHLMEDGNIQANEAIHYYSVVRCEALDGTSCSSKQPLALARNSKAPEFGVEEEKLKLAIFNPKYSKSSNQFRIGVHEFSTNMCGDTVVNNGEASCNLKTSESQVKPCSTTSDQIYSINGPGCPTPQFKDTVKKDGVTCCKADEGFYAGYFISILGPESKNPDNYHTKTRPVIFRKRESYPEWDASDCNQDGVGRTHNYELTITDENKQAQMNAMDSQEFTDEMKNQLFTANRDYKVAVTACACVGGVPTCGKPALKRLEMED